MSLIPASRRTGLIDRTVLSALLFASVCLLVLPERAHAQEQDLQMGSIFELGLGFSIGIPQGEFKRNVPELGWGGTGTIAFRIANSPLSLGGSLGFMIYGQERRKEPFSLTIPDVTVDVITSNNILLGHLLMRLSPAQGVVRPYVEGLVGFKYFWTETRIKDESDPDAEPIARSTNQQDGAFSYGGGVGLAIQVYDGRAKRADTGEGPVSVLVDLRLRFALGSEADYLKRGSIERVGETITYDLQRSKTDFMIPTIGVIIAF